MSTSGPSSGAVQHDMLRVSVTAPVSVPLPVGQSKSLSSPLKLATNSPSAPGKKHLSVQIEPGHVEAPMGASLSGGSVSSVASSEYQVPGMIPYQISVHRASEARRATMANFVPTVSGRIRRSIASIRQSAVLRGELLRRYMAGNVQHEVELRHRVGYFVFTKKWLVVLTVMYFFEVAWFAVRPKDPCTRCWEPREEGVSMGQEQQHQCFVCDFWNWGTITTTTLYILDVILRIYANSCSVFFLKVMNIFDFSLAVLTSFLGYAVPFCWSYTDILKTDRKVLGSHLVTLSDVFQVLRALRLARLTLTYLNILFMVARKATGENKRRYISYEHDFDLDLCYINPRLLAMSVPSAGLMQLYRNPISEVARFLTTFHKASYKIVNMCPELPYKLVNPVGCPVLCPPWSIDESAVHCFDIQDHTPPTLRQFVDFLNLGKEWAIQQEDNVLIVHCRGGKGRTGSFCCAWLLYRKEAEDAEDALTFFAIRRTDMWIGKKVKSQGVETASQRRYIHYMWQLLKRSSTYFPQDIEQAARKPAKLNKLILEGMWARHYVSEVVVIVQDRLTTKAVFISNFGFDKWDLAGIEVVGDLRITFVDVNEFWRRYPTSTLGEIYGGKSAPSSSWSAPLGQKPKTPPKFARAGTEPGCLAFFMVHTTFLPAEHGDGCLCFSKEQLDIGKFGKKKLNPEGFMYLEFSRLPEAESAPAGSLESLGSQPSSTPSEQREPLSPGLLQPGHHFARGSVGHANSLSLTKTLSDQPRQQQAKRLSAAVPLMPASPSPLPTW